MTATPSSSINGPPLGKYLASAEKTTRDKAIKSLTVFLSQNDDEDLPTSEMDKLWKGIFYCFWMSDKPLVQQGLASELAEIVLSIPNIAPALAFLNGFWQTITREWSGIDRLRMDKFHMLVRRFLNASFRLLFRSNWDTQACQQVNDMLTKEGGPLHKQSPADARTPQGLIYHIADIYLEELDKVILASLPTDSEESTPPPTPIGLLLDPFFIVSSQTTQTTTYKRIHAEVWLPLFSSLLEEEESEERPTKRARRTNEEEYPAHIIGNACVEGSDAASKTTLKKQLFKKLLAVASAETTNDTNRRKMYAFWKEAGIDDDDE